MTVVIISLFPLSSPQSPAELVRTAAYGAKFPGRLPAGPRTIVSGTRPRRPDAVKPTGRYDSNADERNIKFVYLYVLHVVFNNSSIGTPCVCEVHRHDATTGRSDNTNWTGAVQNRYRCVSFRAQHTLTRVFFAQTRTDMRVHTALNSRRRRRCCCCGVHTSTTQWSNQRSTHRCRAG